MSEKENQPATPNIDNESMGNVSERVLNAFINKLASEEENAEVAGCLKGVIFNDKVSEKMLRTALFGEEE
jgi:hypothetical protein